MKFEDLEINDLFFVDNNIWCKCTKTTGFSIYKRGYYLNCINRDEKEESDALWQRNYEERKKIEEARKKEREEMKEFIKTVPNRLVKLFGYEDSI